MGQTRISTDFLLYTYLAANTALMAALDATTNKLYGGQLGVPPGVGEPKNFIVFANDGGPGHPDIPMVTERFIFHCYGANLSSLETVYGKLHDALQRKGMSRHTIATTTQVIRRADRLYGPHSIPEPELGWPRKVVGFSIVFCEWALA